MSAQFAIVRSMWHSDVTDGAEATCLARLAEAGVVADNVDLVAVPGAFEIPLRVQQLAETGRYRGIIAIGLVVDGGIYRHDFVGSAVISGLMQVQLATKVPVFSCVLTPHEFREEDPHLGFFVDHLRLKGVEVAEACLATVAA